MKRSWDICFHHGVSIWIIHWRLYFRMIGHHTMMYAERMVLSKMIQINGMIYRLKNHETYMASGWLANREVSHALRNHGYKGNGFCTTRTLVPDHPYPRTVDLPIPLYCIPHVPPYRTHWSTFLQSMALEFWINVGMVWEWLMMTHYHVMLNGIWPKCIVFFMSASASSLSFSQSPEDTHDTSNCYLGLIPNKRRFPDFQYGTKCLVGKEICGSLWIYPKQTVDEAISQP